MISENADLFSNKYSLILNITKSNKNLKFYKVIDDLILQKRFDNQYNLSLNENILRVDNIDFGKNDATDLLENFFNAVKDKTIYQKRNLYEIVKVSYLPQKKLDKYISTDKYNLIADCLDNVSRETNFISFEFLALTAVENFLFKNQDKKELQKKYKLIRNNIYKNMVIKNYQPEKREKETTFLCWIDKILSATVNQLISPDDFTVICQKIIELTTQNLYTYRKILYAANFLLLQQEFSGNKSLRLFQNKIEKNVENNKVFLDLDKDKLEKIIVRILAEEKATKEDYYYMLDAIECVADKSEENKIYCLNVFDYFLYYNQKQNIFSHRYIRKYFLDKFLASLKDKDSIMIKEIELNLLVKILHIDVFFSFNRTEIINYIIQVLASVNTDKNKLTHNNFYKYCDILDYVLANNNDLLFPDMINRLCVNNDNQQKITQRFKLSGLKSAKKL